MSVHGDLRVGSVKGHTSPLAEHFRLFSGTTTLKVHRGNGINPLKFRHSSSVTTTSHSKNSKTGAPSRNRRGPHCGPLYAERRSLSDHLSLSCLYRTYGYYHSTRFKLRILILGNYVKTGLNHEKRIAPSLRLIKCHTHKN